MPTIRSALDTVVFGDYKTVDFFKAITCGLPPAPECTGLSEERHLDKIWPQIGARFFWAGEIPDAKIGTYVVANPYSCDRVGERDPGLVKVGSGLRTNQIRQIAVIQVEVDEGLDGTPLSLSTQADAYDRLEAATGLQFAAIVLSGDGRDSAKKLVRDWQTLSVGKSIHAFLAIQGGYATPEGERLRHRAASALCAILSADYACRDLPRKMRLGGTKTRRNDQVRFQTLLRVGKRSYPLSMVVERLEEYARALGVDIAEDERKHNAAKQLRNAANVWIKAAINGTEPSELAEAAAATLRGIALEARQYPLTDDQRALIAAVGLPAGKTLSTTKTSKVGQYSGHMLSQAGWLPDEVIVRTSKGIEGTVTYMWQNYRKGRGRDEKVPSLHCPFHDDKKASAFLAMSPDKSHFRLICTSCRSIPSALLNKKSKPGSMPSAEDLLDGVEVSELETMAPQPAFYVLTEEEVASRAARTEATWRHDLKHNLRLRAYETSKAERESLPEVDRLVGQILSPAHIEMAVQDFGIEDEVERPRLVLLEEKTKEVLAQALALFDDAMGKCQRGPGVYRAQEGKVTEWRLPCGSRECDICGPRLRRAEKAAISAVVGHLPEGWMGGCLVGEDDMSPTSMDAWQQDMPSKRHWIRLAVDGDSTLTILLWAPEGTPSSAVLKNVDSAFLAPTHLWGVALSQVISAESKPRRHARAVRGSLATMARSTRDYLLGKRLPLPSTGKAFITKASAREVRSKVTEGLEQIGFTVVTLPWDRRAGDGAITRGEHLQVVDCYGDKASASEVESVMSDLGIFQGQKRSDSEDAISGDEDIDGFYDMAI